MKIKSKIIILFVLGSILALVTCRIIVFSRINISKPLNKSGTSSPIIKEESTNPYGFSPKAAFVLKSQNLRYGATAQQKQTYLELSNKFNLDNSVVKKSFYNDQIDILSVEFNDGISCDKIQDYAEANNLIPSHIWYCE